MPCNPKLAALLRKDFIAAISMLAAIGCHRPPTREVDVVFAADQLGFLSPCGCSQHQLGGAARASAFLLGLADAGPTAFIEGGNFLDRELHASPERTAQDRDRADALVRSWEVGAAGLPSVWMAGPFDDAFGRAVRDQLYGKHLADSGKALLDVGGIKIGVVETDGTHTTAAKSAADALRQQGAQVVLGVVHDTWKAASKDARAAGVDLALQSGVEDPVADTDQGAQINGALPIFRVKDKGRGVLVLHIHAPANAHGVVVLESAETRKARADDIEATLKSNRLKLDGAGPDLRKVLETTIADEERKHSLLLAPPPAPPDDQIALSIRFVDLGEDLPESPAAREIFRAYTAEIGKKNLVAQAAKVCAVPKANEPHYRGIQTCKGCHAAPVAVYEATKHAHALQTLVDQGRQYDFDCVQCHVLGYDKPGGACRLDKVKEDGLANVQCESCHGMGAAHAANPKVAMPNPKPGYDTCAGCHTPENDTRFSRETFTSFYLPGVLGPGHGKP